MTDRQPKFTPVLYILMRSDMESMNPGKAVAQGVHAGHVFNHDIQDEGAIPPHMKAKMLGLYEMWKEENGMFGTTVTLDVNGDTLLKVVEFASWAGFMSGIAHDDTYPLLDGATLHLLSIDTCGYVFGDKKELEPLLRQFNLLK